MNKKEELQKLVNESRCLTEILAKKGKVQSQENIQILKDTLDEFGIEHNLLLQFFC